MSKAIGKGGTLPSTSSTQGLVSLTLRKIPENNSRFNHKIYMYRVLGQFTKREQLFCPVNHFHEFEDFLSRHGKVFFKPDNTCCGNGIELWNTEDSDITELYEKASKRTAVLDEPVIQHPDLARTNPVCLSTVRMYTLMIQDTCRIVAAELRMGRRGSIVDNIEKGGLAAGVDIGTGIIIGPVYDLKMNEYPEHPDTGFLITGYQIPNWPKLFRFAKECARACPVRFAEWDFVVRENDCVLIEANANVKNTEMQMGVLSWQEKTV